MADAPVSFRAGDVVRHGPTGEKWGLSCDEEDGEVLPGGWPLTLAKASDCTLIEAASDDKRRARLREVAHPSRDDMRALVARRQLSHEDGTT